MSLKYIKALILTLLSWLGLAGLSDSFVEWHHWFEVGVMQHWRSVKVWMIAVLFDWVPFPTPNWIIDYVLAGSIVFRSFFYAKAVSPRWDPTMLPGRAPRLLRRQYRSSPFFSWKREIASAFLFSLSGGIWAIFLIFMWPIMLFELFRSYLGYFLKRETLVDPDLRQDLRQNQKLSGHSLRYILGVTFLFIPVLFVVSTLLYDHG